MKNKYALITGASGGIGKEIAVELAKEHGYNLLLVARSYQLLEEVTDQIESQYNVDVKYLALDLTEEKATHKVVDWIYRTQCTPSILVNNAGVGLWGKFANLSAPAQLNMMQLNMASLVSLTHAFISILSDHHSYSHILNVASTAAYQPVPTLSVYAATKAFVVSFSQSLSHELRHSKVNVSYLSPGATNTGFVDRAGMGRMKEFAEKFSMSPEQVARVAVRGMLRNKKEIIPGAANYLSSKIASLMPTWLTARLTGKIYEKHLVV